MSQSKHHVVMGRLLGARSLILGLGARIYSVGPFALAGHRNPSSYSIDGSSGFSPLAGAYVPRRFLTRAPLTAAALTHFIEKSSACFTDFPRKENLTRFPIPERKDTHPFPNRMYTRSNEAVVPCNEEAMLDVITVTCLVKPRPLFV